ncbi:MAG: hypothetical protein MN733_00180 [Nitrososphaera sp.]|nr:hypothetical protein [Nitrososphaera sp.]
MGDESVHSQRIFQSMPAGRRVGIPRNKWWIAAPVVAVVLGGTLIWMFRSEKVDVLDVVNGKSQVSNYDLSRNTAENKITEKLEPVTQYGVLSPIKVFFDAKGAPREGVVPSEAIKGREKELSDGLIKISYLRRDWRSKANDEISSYWYVFAVTTTELGARYVDSKTGQVKLADRHLIEVTGVTKPSDMLGQIVSNVQFTYKLVTTPFGKIYLAATGNDKTLTGSATFALYDDGWRLEHLSYR